MTISARTIKSFEIYLNSKTRHVVEFHPQGIMINNVRVFKCVVPEQQNQQSAVYFLLEHLYGETFAQEWYDTDRKIRKR